VFEIYLLLTRSAYKYTQREVMCKQASGYVCVVVFQVIMLCSHVCGYQQKPLISIIRQCWQLFTRLHCHNPDFHHHEILEFHSECLVAKSLKVTIIFLTCDVLLLFFYLVTGK
jgi:hypothetical protein